MGRTTDEKKGKTVILRISEDLKGQLESESKEKEISVSEYIRKILEERGSKNEVCNTGKPASEENSVIQNEIISESTLKDLEQMCRLSGFTTVRFFDRIDEMFNDGSIYVDGIQLKTRGKYDTRELENVCHRMNADPQDMISKLVKSLMRG